MRYEYVKCNLCGSDEARSIGKRESPDKKENLKTNIVRCSRCGLLYPNPMPRLTSSEIQDSFNKPIEYFSGDTEKRIRLFENALNKIERIKPEKGGVLDVGCGRGEFLYVANKRGWEAIGTDISRAFVNYAKDNFNVNTLIGDLEDIDLPQESFDAVSLISVIQYLQNPIGTLKKVNSLLKKDGVLYIETTNEDALIFKMGDFFKSIKEGKKMTTHLSPLFPSFQIYGFNKKSLSFALKKIGFKISYIKIKGIIGGGEVKGFGLSNKIINLMRKIIALIGGLTGNGHLIYCIARKV